MTQNALDRSAPAVIEDVLALSPLQEGLFSLSKIAGDDLDVYTMQFIVDISGPVDTGTLRRSVEAILERHPNLRVSFWDKDLPNPVQIVPTWVDLPWTELDALPDEFDAIAQAQRQRRFDLSSGPALRVVLVTMPDARRRLLVTAHHILMDGWAIAIFFQELLAAYEAGGNAEMLPPTRPYRDYIGWLAEQDTVAATAAWIDYLAPLTGPVKVADGAAVGLGGVPQRTRVQLGEADTARLIDWARTNGLTINTAVQFAWAVVLGRLTDRSDVVFGTTIAGRPESLRGVESMIGLFINTVPSLVVLDPRTSVNVQCVRMQRESARMRDLGYLSLSSIQRAAGHGNMFDTLFVFENAPIGAVTEPISTSDGTRFLPVAMESLAHYPLTIAAFVQDDMLVVMAEAVAEALPNLPAAEIVERILLVLRQLPDVQTEEQIDVLLPGERPVGRGEVAVPPGTIADLFIRQVEKSPDSPALTSTGESYTYQELHDQVMRLAHHLIDAGAGPETVVAVALDRSPDSVVGILAALAAGAAYVPVDLELPAARMESILRQSNPVVIVTAQSHVDVLAAAGASSARTVLIDGPQDAAAIALLPAARPQVQTHPDLGAYLIFTSGSTGEPKGVIGTNRALASYFTDHRDRVYARATARLGRKLRIAHAWSLSFDASWQPLVGLLDGHCVHLFDAVAMRDARQLVAGIIEHGIDMIDTSPSMFGQLVAAGLLPDDSEQTPLSVLALGGEAISQALWQQLQGFSDLDVYNCYGPTEATVEAVVASVEESAAPTVGDAVDRMTAYVLDSRLRVAPRGVLGELYLAGEQVTRGYAGAPGTTAASFVANPMVAGGRMYRTGDLVRRLADGNLSFLGRADGQVKIRGYRVEIGEIETALRRLPGVDAAAVVVVRRRTNVILIGFVVGADLSSAAARNSLADRLPSHMMPARVISLAALPMTSNGKLDNSALLATAQTALDATDGHASVPATDTERLLSSVIVELFGGPDPGVDEDFFDLGMDSIVAMSLVNRLRREELQVSPRVVLDNPSIRTLAAAIDSGGLGESESAGAQSGPGEVVALPVVRWLYDRGSFRRFTQTTLIALPVGLTDTELESVLQALLDSHDMLRAQLLDNPSGPRLVSRAAGTISAADILTTMPAGGDLDRGVREGSRAAMERIDPLAGAMVAAVRLEQGTDNAGDVLVLAIHHLSTDAVSWHVLFGDLADCGRQVAAGETPKLAGEYTTYRRWSHALTERSGTPEVLAQRDYWAGQFAGPDPIIGSRRPGPGDTWSTLKTTSADTSVELTASILEKLSGDTGMREFLLAALTMTISTWRTSRGEDGSGGTLIALEGHGREDTIAGAGIDTSQTVGWFTTVFPVRVGSGAAPGDVEAATRDPRRASELLTSVTRQIGEIPNRGLDYGLLRHFERLPELVSADDPQIEFNYLGRFDLSSPGAADTPTAWAPITELELNENLPTAPEPDLPLRYALDVVAVVRGTPQGPQLISSWRWSDALMTGAEADQLAQIWRDAVAALAAAL